MRRLRNKQCKLTITSGDREIVRARYPQMSKISIDRRAVARAAGREVLADSKSTAEALDSLVLSVPAETLRVWMKDWLKKAA